ncbi:MAG TPA: 3',5'-cyclic-nucleotide phosphodiesterase [Chitinophagaceae bacterium]|nr:3',5'-cyclic-nucleotide phosphodiesterase [Chitinophagaceae bacterium]
MTKYGMFCCLYLLLHGLSLTAQTSGKASFTIVPLGVRGGLDESNLSAYMLAPGGSNDYICLDAGTLYTGIQKAVKAHAFDSSESVVLKKYIKGYLISHAHLDHVAGLIINAPDDAPKNIYGTPFCLNIIRDKYFSWQSWANFANEGEKPALGKYHYVYLGADSETAIEHTSMYVRAFALSHGNPYQSTAFLIRHDSAYALYLGDTGADEVEKAGNLRALWQAIAPLVKTGQLKGIFIEVSYSNAQPEKQLFGHLTPQLLMKEMAVLGSFTGPEALRGLPVLVTHIKPASQVEATIRAQLQALNILHINFLFPRQGKRIQL